MLEILDITNKYIVVNLYYCENEFPKLYLYFINYRNPSDTHYFKMNINIHPIGGVTGKENDIIFLGKVPTDEVYLYSIEKNDIYGICYLVNYVDIIKIVNKGNTTYLTMRFEYPPNNHQNNNKYDNRFFLSIYKHTRRRDIGDRKTTIDDVKWFDASDNYLITANKWEVEPKTAHSKYLAKVCIYDKQYNISLKRQWKLSDNIKDPYSVEIIPSISPDEKKAVIFQTYSNEKPIIIKLK